jgi:hypothetical protein
MGRQWPPHPPCGSFRQPRPIRHTGARVFSSAEFSQRCNARNGATAATAMNMLEIPEPGSEALPTPTDLVGIRECGKEIGVSPSTISRQLTRALFKNWGTADAPKVSLAEVRQARANKLDPAQQRSAPAKAAKVETGFHADRAARESIRRQSEELDFKERLGKILSRAEVEDDFESFARSLRERFRQGAPNLVLELEQLPTSAAREARMIEAVEQLFAQLADELDSMADAAGG